MTTKQQLINYWTKSKIITDKQVLKAFKEVPRENFLPKNIKDLAYQDTPLSIGEQQTISQPSTVMIMTQALEVKQNNKILEIGAGSGYQAAILSKLAPKGKIYTTEINKKLTKFAKNNLKSYKNVKVIYIDGSKGLKQHAPFNRIIITAACPKTPSHLIKQLNINGILIAPIGYYTQRMLKIKKISKTKIIIQDLGNFRFVPLRGKYGF